MDMYETSDSSQKLANFWENAKLEISQIKTDQMTFKSQELPLARIKKIMKLDDVVKTMMISAEAPILFAKAAELFIREITLRAWIHTERNKRRTLQRSDITLAVGDGDTDQFDFLIDIVPRDEIKNHGVNTGAVGSSGSNCNNTKREETVSHMTTAQLTGNNNNSATLTMQQQNSGAQINLFNQMTSHGLSTVSQPTATLLGGIVDSNGNITVNTNLLGTGSNQQNNSANVQHSNQPLQYVLQLPVGATTNSLSGTSAIQIQMIPQQTILSNNGTDGTVTTLTTSGVSNASTVINGQQQIFTLSGSGALSSNIITQSNSNQSNTAMVLPSGILTSSSNNSISVPITYTTSTNDILSIEQDNLIKSNSHNQHQHNMHNNNNVQDSSNDDNNITAISSSNSSPMSSSVIVNTTTSTTTSANNNVTTSESVTIIKEEHPSPVSNTESNSNV